MPEVRHGVFLYGKWQWVRYRTAACLAKFLRGHQVRAVWMQFEDEEGNLSKPRLLISTNSAQNADEVFKGYARRWAIEDLFNQMKNGWGWREAWQQSRQTLHRWTQILLQRAAARPAQTDTMAEKGTGDSRAGASRPAVVFRPCPGSGLVGSDMPEIRAQCNPSKTRRNRPSCENRLETAIKEQRGSQSAPAIMTMA